MCAANVITHACEECRRPDLAEWYPLHRVWLCMACLQARFIAGDIGTPLRRRDAETTAVTAEGGGATLASDAEAEQATAEITDARAAGPGENCPSPLPAASHAGNPPPLDEASDDDDGRNEAYEGHEQWKRMKR